MPNTGAHGDIRQRNIDFKKEEYYNYMDDIIYLYRTSTSPLELINRILQTRNIDDTKEFKSLYKELKNDFEKINEFKLLNIYQSYDNIKELHTLFINIQKKIKEIITQKEIKIPETDIFFSNYHNKEMNDRIKKTNGSCDNLLSLNYNGVNIEDEYNSELVFEKLNNLETNENPALFSLSVRFYNWKLKDLSLNVGTVFTTVKEALDNSKRSKMLGGFFELSLPYKEEAKRILLYIGYIIINKNNSVKIQGGITVEEDGKKVSLLFIKKKTERTIQKSLPKSLQKSLQKAKGKGKARRTLFSSNNANNAEPAVNRSDEDATAAAATALSIKGTYTHNGTTLQNMGENA